MKPRAGKKADSVRAINRRLFSFLETSALWRHQGPANMAIPEWLGWLRIAKAGARRRLVIELRLDYALDYALNYALEYALD